MRVRCKLFLTLVFLGYGAMTPGQSAEHIYALDQSASSQDNQPAVQPAAKAVSDKPSEEELFLDKTTAPGQDSGTTENPSGKTSDTDMFAAPSGHLAGEKKSLLGSEKTAVQAPSAENAVGEPGAATEKAGDIATGERIHLEGRGFSIVPPMGWLVHRDLPRTSLFLQPKMIDATEYPRNIAVVKFSGPTLINDATAEKFAQYLVKNFPAASPEISEYRLRNHQRIDMADGREGILLYTDFSVRSKPMMQAHVLVSSETNHYLITYTDVAEHFESEASGRDLLALAWASMTSVELDSPNPKPFESMQYLFMLGGGLLTLFVIIAYARNRVAGKIYRNYGDMDPGEADEVDPRTEHGSLSLVETETEDKSGAVSRMSTQHAQVLEFRTRQHAPLAASRKKASSQDKDSIESADVSESTGESSLHDDDDNSGQHWKVS